MTALTKQIKDRQFWLEFINEYRSLPCLWDENHVNYASRKIREQAFFKLLKKVQTVWPEAQIDFVKQRINNFRRTFINEYNKVQQSRQNGTGSYVPSLYYYNHLRFLKEDAPDPEQSDASDEDSHFEPSASNDEIQDQTISISELSNDAEFMVANQPVSLPSNEFYVIPSSNNECSENSRPSKRQRLLEVPSDSNTYEVDSSEYHLEEVSENVNILEIHAKHKNVDKNETEFSEIEVFPETADTEDFHRAQTYTENEFDVIAKRVAMHFKKMNPQQCLYAERLIFDVCISGRLNRLTEETNLSNSSTRQKNNISFTS